MHHQNSSTDPPPMESLPSAPFPPPLPPSPLHPTLQSHPNAPASSWYSSLPGFVHSPTSLDAPPQPYQYTPWPTSPYPDFTSAAMAAAAAASGILQGTPASPQQLFPAPTTNSPSLTPSSTTDTIPSSYFPSGELDPSLFNVPSPSPYPLPSAAASSEDIWRAMQMLPSPSMVPTSMHAQGEDRRSTSTGNLQSVNVMTPARILAGEKSRGRTTLPVVSSPLGISASAPSPVADPAARRKTPARRRAASRRDDEEFEDDDEEEEIEPSAGRGRRKGGAGTNGGGEGTSAAAGTLGVRSAFHKRVEQKRREQLRDAFDSLVHSLPPEYLRPGWVVRRDHNVRSLQFAMEATRAIVDAATAAAAGKRRGREEDEIAVVAGGGRRATGARGVKTAMSISKRPFLSAVRNGANLKEDGVAEAMVEEQQLQQQQQQQQQLVSESGEGLPADVASSAATLNRVDILVRVLYFITELQERERERERTVDELRQRLQMLRPGSVGAASVVSESSNSSSTSSSGSTGMVIDG